MNLRVAFLFVLWIFCGSAVCASVPEIINFQGRLLDASGQPMIAATQVSFEIFDALEAGNSLWRSAIYNIVPNGQGLFSVNIGSNNDPIHAAVFSSGPRYFEITVLGNPLSPRQELSTSPFAFQAADSETLSGKTANDFLLTSGGILTGALAVEANPAATTFYADPAMGRVGIGTRNPTNSLGFAGGGITYTALGSGGITLSNAAGGSTGQVVDFFNNTTADFAQMSVYRPGGQINTGDFQYYTLGPNYSAPGTLLAPGSVFMWSRSDFSNGIRIGAQAGPIIFFNGGFNEANEKMRIDQTGQLILKGKLNVGEINVPTIYADPVFQRVGIGTSKLNNTLSFAGGGLTYTTLGTGGVTLNNAAGGVQGHIADFFNNTNADFTQMSIYRPGGQVNAGDFQYYTLGPNYSAPGTLLAPSSVFMWSRSDFSNGIRIGAQAGPIIFFNGGFNAGNEKMRIDQSGHLFLSSLGIGAGTNLVIGADNQVILSSSSRRYKNDIKNLAIDSSQLELLRPVSFRWNEKTATPNKEDVGLIAEEVYKVFPGLVGFNSQGEIESVDYLKLSVILLAIAQEQQKRIVILENKLDQIGEGSR